MLSWERFKFTFSVELLCEHKRYFTKNSPFVHKERLINLRAIGTPVFSQIACGVNFTHMDCRLRSLQQLDLLVGELVKIAG